MRAVATELPEHVRSSAIPSSVRRPPQRSPRDVLRILQRMDHFRARPGLLGSHRTCLRSEQSQCAIHHLVPARLPLRLPEDIANSIDGYRQTQRSYLGDHMTTSFCVRSRQGQAIHTMQTTCFIQIATDASERFDRFIQTREPKSKESDSYESSCVLLFCKTNHRHKVPGSRCWLKPERTRGSTYPKTNASAEESTETVEGNRVQMADRDGANRVRKRRRADRRDHDSLNQQPQSLQAMTDQWLIGHSAWACSNFDGQCSCVA